MKQIELFDVPILLKPSKRIRGFKLQRTSLGMVLTYHPLLSMKMIKTRLSSEKEFIQKSYATYLQLSTFKPSKIPVWGEMYDVTCVTGNNRYTIDHTSKHVTLYLAEENSVTNVVTRMYIDEMKRRFDEMKDVQEMMQAYCNQVTIRAMKSRWGSCTMKKKSIRLNAFLAMYPFACARCVFAHELCHLRHPNHQKAFYDDLLAHYPTYFADDKRLKILAKSYTNIYPWF